MQTCARRILRLCTQRGLFDDTQADRLSDGEPVLAALTASSVRGIICHRGTRGPALATCPERSGHQGAYGAPVLCFARLSQHGATRIASAHPRSRAPFLRAQNAVVGWDEPSSGLAPGTIGEADGSGTPTPVWWPCRAVSPGLALTGDACGDRGYFVFPTTPWKSGNSQNRYSSAPPSRTS